MTSRLDGYCRPVVKPKLDTIKNVLYMYRVEQKNPAKFGDSCSVRAGQWAEKGRGKFKHVGIFCMTQYFKYIPDPMK